MSSAPAAAISEPPRRSRSDRWLDWIERTGNRLPDPAVHFLIAIVVVWVLSAVLAPVDFGVTDPRTGQPLRVINLLSPVALTRTLESVVPTYVAFPPLGIVLVLALGVGVAEHSGLVGAALKRVLDFAPAKALTPMVVGATVMGAIGGDATLLVMAPVGGAAFYAAGRHPLAGITAAFSANMMLIASFAPTGIDLVIQNFTERAAHLLDPTRQVNPLCNWGFMATAGVLVTITIWIVVDKLIEPRLRSTPVDADPSDLPSFGQSSQLERRSLLRAAIVALLIVGATALAAAPSGSPLRAPDGSLTGLGAPLMKGLVPILLLLTALPGMAYGYSSGTLTNHKDVIRAMSKTMSSMGYYMVMAFFAAQFIRAFGESNLGALIALKGGLALKALALAPLITLAGVMVLTGGIDLIVASASAKWAVLAPVFVPMLMTAGISPETTQLAYRIGESPTNLITPLNPYFPLVVAFCARYVRNAGIGTIVSMSVPVAVACTVVLWLQLAVFWTLGLPAGIQAPYIYP